MISPELLRRYPFFAQLDSEQLRRLAMIAQEERSEPDEVVLEQDRPAEKLYFLLDGCMDLYYTVQDAYWPDQRQEIMVCEIAPGEPFGISALIEPHMLSSTARACRCSRMIAFERMKLQELFESDQELEKLLLRRIAQAAMERLHGTRVQLAAAWA